MKKIKLGPIILFVCLAGLSMYFLLKSHWLPDANWESLQYLFQVHHEAFKKTDGYVPLEEYNTFYKFFTFYYRPFPSEISTAIGWLTGIENIISLLITICGVCFLTRIKIKFKYKLSFIELSLIIFFVLLAIILSLAYSNFGLISRMKNQSLPYMLILCIYWISKYIKLNKNEET